MSLRAAIYFLGILFVLSGLAGLLAEQSFEKLLTNLIGASTPSAAVVLSVYFLGLSLGAWLYALYRNSNWNPLRTYALLEAGIAGWSIILLISHQGLIDLFIPVLRLGSGHFYVLQGLRTLVASIWILPPTIFMGATFPAVIDVLEALRIPKPRRTLVCFYALNLMGAICGALLGPYWNFPVLGLGGTLIFTFFIDGLVAIGAWYLAKCFHQLKSTVKIADSISPSTFFLITQNWTLVILAFCSGFVFFALEILWTQLIGISIGNSVYAFAAMLAIVLTGLGLGSILSTLLFKERRPIKPGSLIFLLILGFFALVWQYKQWPETSSFFVIWGANLTLFSQGEILRWILSARLLLPPAIILGMFYPLLFRLSCFPLKNRASISAIMSAFNSIGCALGALMTSFMFIPWLGSAATLILLIFLISLMSLTMAITFLKGINRWVMTIPCITLFIFLPRITDWDWLKLSAGNHVYFQTSHVTNLSKLIFLHEDTQGGLTTVIANPFKNFPSDQTHFVKILLTNGKFQANDAGERDAQKGFVIVPSLHLNSFNDALVIGLGSGQSAATVNEFGFKHIDIAEIAPGIVQAANQHFSHINGGILQKPNVKLFIEDGRNFLLLTKRSYDLITMEISSIWFANSTSLYSKNFYDLAKLHLKPGGILQQWIQIHHISEKELLSVIGTIKKSFKFVSFWIVGEQGILVASESPQKLQKSALDILIKANPWAEKNNAQIYGRIRNLLASRLLASDELDNMLHKIQFTINTDLNRYLEYATPKYNLSPIPYHKTNIRFLLQFASFQKFLVNDWTEADCKILQNLPVIFQRNTKGF